LSVCSNDIGSGSRAIGRSLFTVCQNVLLNNRLVIVVLTVVLVIATIITAVIGVSFRVE
jgi:hypothetical protein